MAAQARPGIDALLEIIDDILDFSKIEAGKLALVEDRVDIEALLSGVSSMLADRCTPRT